MEMVSKPRSLQVSAKEAAASGSTELSETELSAANYLESLRKEGEGYLDLQPIYSLNAFSYRLIELIDSGKRIFEYYHLI